MSRMIQRLFLGLLGLVLLVWIGYHGFNQYYRPMEVETVFEYTVSRSVSGRGIVIRDEMIIEQPVTGIENYIHDDGTRISIGEPVAEFYATNAGDTSFKRMREIQEEIDMLTLAQDKTVNNHSNSDMISRDIREQLGIVTQMNGTGRYTQATDVRDNLLSLISRRQVATGKVEDYSQEIAALRQELQGLQQHTASENVVVANAPVSGYFIKSLDGGEQAIHPRILGSYSLGDYTKLIDSFTYSNPGNYVGKLMLSQDWYVAAAVTQYETEWLNTGMGVQLYLNEADTTVQATVQDILTERDNEDAVVILRCNQISEELVNLRVTDLTIQFFRYTGLRINTDSFRFQDNVRGVYVLEDNIVKFKEINPIYEEPGFVLLDTKFAAAYGENKEVCLFDQVITKGTDLYHGKIIQ